MKKMFISNYFLLLQASIIYFASTSCFFSLQFVMREIMLGIGYMGHGAGMTSKSICEISVITYVYLLYGYK